MEGANLSDYPAFAAGRKKKRLFSLFFLRFYVLCFSAK